MAESMALTLRVDPPYLGESLSSFLGRAAQFYRTPYHALMGELLSGNKQFGKGMLDLDLNPSPALERKLTQTVPGWVSPLEGFKGFYGPVVMCRSRHAYCPRCFK